MFWTLPKLQYVVTQENHSLPVGRSTWLSNRELYVSPIVYCTLVFISFNVVINHYSMPLGYDVGPPVDETIISIQLAGGSIFQYILPRQGNMCEAICIKLVGFMVLNLTGIGQISGCNLPKGLFFADVLASLEVVLQRAKENCRCSDYHGHRVQLPVEFIQKGKRST